MSDSLFLAGLESDSLEVLKRIEDALKYPVYAPYLGRRSCPPTLPVVLGIRDDKLTEVLKNEPSENKSTKRIVYDSVDEGVAVRDVPTSFSQLHRQYGYRIKKEETLFGAEHDPMSEL